MTENITFKKTLPKAQQNTIECLETVYQLLVEYEEDWTGGYDYALLSLIQYANETISKYEKKDFYERINIGEYFEEAWIVLQAVAAYIIREEEYHRENEIEPPEVLELISKALKAICDTIKDICFRTPYEEFREELTDKVLGLEEDAFSERYYFKVKKKKN